MKHVQPTILSLISAAILSMLMVSALGSDEAEWPQFTLPYDPSHVALTNDHQSTHCPQAFFERWRIVTDLNGDGNDDLIISEDPAYFGNGGGPWSVYINSNGNWRCIGGVGMYPGVFAMDKIGDHVELWYYWHMSAQEGVVGYYTFNPNGTMEKHQTENNIVVKGDSDGDFNSLFDCLQRAIFGHAHRHPYRFEKSETSADGVVTWHEIRDWKVPSLSDELFDLKMKLDEATRSLESKESELRLLKERIAVYVSDMCVVSGVPLGEKWNGGELTQTCKEEFSGFTNMVVFVDSSGFVDRIRLTRKGEAYTGFSSIRGNIYPNDEEMKVIHQIENKFRTRLNRTGDSGSHDWESSLPVMQLTIHFSDNINEYSYIDLKYSRRNTDGERKDQ